MLERLGFRRGVLRWVSLLFEGTCAMARFGGGYSRIFRVRSGAAQGSPLSPLLFVAAVQPLAARLRHLQAGGQIDAIRLPDGRLAPPWLAPARGRHHDSHAGPTCARTRRCRGSEATADGAAAALRLGITPFCLASGSALNLTKSRALALGSHPPVQGNHPTSGIQFLAPGAAVRHLGIWLTAGDRAAAAAEMWSRLLSGVAARLQHWRGVDLSYAGRVHVAKQVLAASLVHVATFIEPPQPQLHAIQRLIDGYVALGGADAGSDGPLRSRPAEAVAALPRNEGGADAASVAVHGMALRAKVAAALLHPRRHPWKALAAAAFEAALPGIGVAALLSNLPPGGHRSPRLPRRLVSYWRAFCAARPQRLLHPAEMLPQQVGLEPLAGSCRVGAPGGSPAPVGMGEAAAVWGTARRLRDLPTLAVGVPPAAVVPAAWAAMLAQPQSRTGWEASADGRWVRYAPSAAAARLFAVAADGRLVERACNGRNQAGSGGCLAGLLRRPSAARGRAVAAAVIGR